MKTKHGYITGVSKEYDISKRDGCEVTLSIRVRMSLAEAKELDALCDDGKGMAGRVGYRRSHARIA